MADGRRKKRSKADISAETDIAETDIGSPLYGAQIIS